MPSDLFAVAGLGLGLLLPRITVAPTVASSRVTDALIWVGFGVLGLVSIIFSLLFLVVQWAFSSLSPRLNLFRDDPIVWRTFRFAVGVFVFSVTAALVIGNDPEVSVIVPAAEVAGVLAALALIRALQVKAFASIQLAPTLSAIAARGRSILDDLYPRPRPDSRPPGAPLPPLRRAVAWPHRQAILQQLDLRQLVGAAGGAVIVLRARIGDTLQDGTVVAGLHGGDVSDAAILGGLVTGQERTFGEDPLLRVPAAGRHRLAGAVKVVLALPSWDDYLRIALEDLIESASRSPMVLLRARALLTGLLDAAPPQRRSSITWRLQRAEELAASNFPLIWRHAAGADPA